MKNRKLSKADIQARAENVNSKFLKSYRKSSNTIWRMKCEEGHQYERLMSVIRDGHGCSDPRHKGQSRFAHYKKRHDEYYEECSK
jgi:hypothetical protein